MNKISSEQIILPEDNLDAWLAWQETISPKGIDLNLDRVSKVFGRLTFNRPKHLITIAGTNGKGSTVAMIESLMIAQGISVGSYTSPHMHRYNERIKINGIPVSNDSITQAFKEIEKKRNGEQLTYFEFGTLAALVIISKTKIDVAVLEVGLGGRLDAVNIVDSDGCIITNISKDHSEWLGEEIEMIAKEKAGVMRRGKPIIFGSNILPLNISREAERKRAILVTQRHHYKFNEAENNLWNWKGVKESREGISKPILSGSHQIENAAAVLALMENLPGLSVPEKEIINIGMKSIDLPGRTDIRSYSKKTWLFDVAHNFDSALKLNKTIEGFSYNKCIVVISILLDKDIEGIIKTLTSIVDQWIIVDLDANRALKSNRLKQLISKYSQKRITIGGNPKESMQKADFDSKSDDLIVITGSFYTVAPCLKWIEKRAT